MAKISATGSIAGGIDTLGLIPGFRSELGVEEFAELVSRVGIAHITQTDSFCPADAVLIDVRRERCLMKHNGLAAVSLLSKKIVVQGSNAVFDFRVGPTGNIGDSLEAATVAADLFQVVSHELGIEIDVVLTDNVTFPSSALGRLESLDLLVKYLTRSQALTAIDLLHRDTCIHLASVGLASSLDQPLKDARRAVAASLDSGRAYELFLNHLVAQGASPQGLAQALDQRSRQLTQTIHADQSGYWLPPDIGMARDWVKKTQAELGMALADQLGIRLLSTPGDQVVSGQALLSVLLPSRGREIPLPAWIAGSIQTAPPTRNEGTILTKSRRSS